MKLEAEYWHGDQFAANFLGDRSSDLIPLGHNYVDVDAIMLHREFRTTAMLRNIPNTMTLVDLEQILNLVCPGKYDFVYLRVDFNNQHNVGYAFINFIEVQFLASFVMFISGRSWNRYSGNKVAHVCFAAMQGVDTLIAHFRNSAVQQQWAPFRANWYWSDHIQPDGGIATRPNAGQKRPFPPPNAPLVVGAPLAPPPPPVVTQQ